MRWGKRNHKQKSEFLSTWQAPWCLGRITLCRAPVKSRLCTVSFVWLNRNMRGPARQWEESKYMSTQLRQQQQQLQQRGNQSGVSSSCERLMNQTTQNQRDVCSCRQTRASSHLQLDPPPLPALPRQNKPLVCPLHVADRHSAVEGYRW